MVGIILTYTCNMTVVRYDPKMLEADRQEQLADWGFTAVRLGSMWSGVEPLEGEVSDCSCHWSIDCV